MNPSAQNLPESHADALAEHLIAWSGSAVARRLELQCHASSKEALGYLFIRVLPRSSVAADVAALVRKLAPFYFRNYCRDERRFRIEQSNQARRNL